jgi:hypothetical protein
MRGYYEKQWQNAFDGASIQPSDALWGNIESSVADNNSNRMWMTILLIAATVTIAFAFPLTIGNSSFEARPENFQNLSQVEVNEKEAQYSNKVNNLASAQNNNQIASINNNRTDSGAPLISVTSVKNTSEVGNTLIDENMPPVANLANTHGYGLSSLDMGVDIPDKQLGRYYLIPYYIPFNKEKRNLLASLNMGAGSSSAGSGFSGLGAYESADMLASEPMAGSMDSDNRNESNGSTYYIGAGVELPIGNKWSLLSGLGYLTQTAIGTSNIVLDNGENYLPLGAYDPILPGTVFLTESYDYTVKNSYINIPLTLKYSVINRKFKLRTGFGLSTDFMLSHNLSSDGYGSANYNPSLMDFKPVVLVGLINLDISYSLNNHYSVALETGLRKGFTAVDNSQEYYPSSFTVGIILFYKIQR